VPGRHIAANILEESKEASMQCPYCKEEILDGATKCKHCNSVIGATTEQPAYAVQDNFGELFTAALGLWKANLGDLAVLTLVFMLVIWIPIANIGFIAGYTRSVLKVARGQGKAEVGDLFNAWDCFGNLLVYVVLLIIAGAILHFVPVLGSIAAIVLGFVAMPGMYAIIDGRRGTIDAFKWSLATIQADMINWLLVYIVSYVITMAGLIVFVIGAILTMPLGMLISLQQYERVKPA
jgi:ribosomal protein L37AE/L43A